MKSIHLRINLTLLALLILCLTGCRVETPKASFNPKVGNQPDGSILVPTNQLLRPAGLQLLLRFPTMEAEHHSQGSVSLLTAAWCM
jgi:hypothetical protein